MRRAISAFVVLSAILLGSLAAGSPTAVDTPAVSTAGIDLGTPVHHTSRVQAAVPELVATAAVLRLLLQVLAAGLAVVLVVAITPLRTQLGIPLAAGRRGPPSLLG
jgi:hypothetical protein